MPNPQTEIMVFVNNTINYIQFVIARLVNNHNMYVYLGLLTCDHSVISQCMTHCDLDLKKGHPHTYAVPGTIPKGQPVVRVHLCLLFWDEPI